MEVDSHVTLLARLDERLRFHEWRKLPGYIQLYVCVHVGANSHLWQALSSPSLDANYLLKALQGFQSHGITAYAIGIQVSMRVRSTALKC